LRGVCTPTNGGKSSKKGEINVINVTFAGYNNNIKKE